MTEVSVQESLVTPAWLVAHQNDPKVRLIEIAGIGQEEMQAYKAGHVPGAVCWKWEEMLWDSHVRDLPRPEEFARRLGTAGIGNDTTVVFYGERAPFGIYAWWVFKYCGHDKVCVLDGARYRWAEEGRPLVTDVPAPVAPVQYKRVARNENMRIWRDEVLDALDKPGKVILDGRSPEEYSGQRVGAPDGPDVGAVRYGRIPGARHLFFNDLLTANKGFKSPSELRVLVEARGATADKEIVTYCRMGHRATVLYFALTQLLGYKNVRVYDGSWTEWGNLAGVPVER
ncbi:MAG: sulfurtransferase [Betaproteobacteria bacterium]|nr:sulfurtransferase [Betaproteobacteria bacterium]